MSSNKRPLPSFMRRMTPEKYQAMSKEEQRAYDQKANAWMKKFDAEIERKNAEAHKTIAFGVAQLIQLDPAVEFEIVKNYLNRTGQSLVPAGSVTQHPELELARPSKKAARTKNAK